MADQTMTDRNVGSIYAGGGKKETVLAAAGEAGITPGHVVRIVSNIAYLSKSTDSNWAGVADCEPGHEIETAYTITTDTFHVIRKGNGSYVWGFIEATSPVVNIAQDDPIIIGTEDGKMRRMSYAGDIGDFADLIGYADEAITVSATDDKVARVRMI